MGAQSNGHVVPNGVIVQKPRHDVPIKRRVQRRSLVRRGTSIIARLLAWYSIFTVLFRCPSSPASITDSTPQICTPYFKARSYISPALEPYYNAYAAPCIDSARPYVSAFDSKVLTPAVSVGKHGYERYGASHVDRALKYGQAEWETIVRPRFDSAKASARKTYEASVSPHVNKVVEATFPYYESTRHNLFQTYDSHLLPTYIASLPYAQRAYVLSHSLVVHTGLPYVQSAWNTGKVFVQRTLWPRVRILYGQNVEPQLVRIGERLGRNRGSKSIESVVQEAERTIRASASSAGVSSMAARADSISTSLSTTYSSVAAQSSENASRGDSRNGAPDSEEVRRIIANDLKNWREKFAKASDKGAEDLEEQVKEITDTQIKKQVQGVGEALLIELEEMTNSQLEDVKNRVISIVEGLPDHADEAEQDKANEEIMASAKGAGLAIKGKAQAVRKWKQEFYDDTLSLVWKATESTLAVIDSIRDLGLQELGMKWAWMDGVTYKDWAKFHAMKDTFEEWRENVQNVAKKHEGLVRVKNAAEDLEGRSLAVAEGVAEELARIKRVGKWKLQTRDVSNDFSDKHIPAAAANAGQKVLGKMQDVVEPVSANAAQAASHISHAVVDNAAEASASIRKVAGKETQGFGESASSVAASQASVASSKVSGAVLGSEEPIIQSVQSRMSEKLGKTASRASDAVLGTDLPAHEKALSGASSRIGSMASAVSEAIPGGTTSSLFAERVSESASAAGEAASSVVDKASKKVWGGAAAQTVSVRKIEIEEVIEDDDTPSYSDKIQSLAHEAGDGLHHMTEAVREALLRSPSSQASAASESATPVAGARYSSALSAASSILYGTESKTTDGFASVASEKYAQAIDAASSIIYGTPTPTVNSLAAAASSQYFEAISKAHDQYVQAKSAVFRKAKEETEPEPLHKQMLSSVEAAYSGSVHSANQKMQSAMSALSTGIYGTPVPAYQSALSGVNQKLSDAVCAASDKYEKARLAISGSPTPARASLLSAAASKYSDMLSGASSAYSAGSMSMSSAYYGPTQGALESISSVASSKLAEGLSQASAQYASARDAMKSEPTPAQHPFVLDAQRRYYEAVGLAHHRYSEFVTSASSVIYGTPTPTYQSLYNAASEAIYGSPQPAYQSALSAAQKQYSDAVEAASSRLAQVVAKATSAAGKTSQGTAESVLSVASSKYSAALAAASSSLSSASVAASTVIYGTPQGSIESMASVISEKAGSAASIASSSIIGSETPWTESMASVASANWENLISKASEQVYGSPTPFTASVVHRAGEYAAQATDGVAAQMEAMRSLVSELISGREPDFTESVMNRFNSAIYTGAPAIASSVSSYAGEAYASASSVAASVFTPPAALEAILEGASNQIGSVIEAASIQAYGTSKGTVEKASSAAAEKYSSAQSKVSSAVYGTSTGYAEAAQSSISEAAASASSAISVAIYGTPTSTVGQVRSAAGGAYSSASSAISDTLSSASAVAGDGVASIQSKVSSAIYGPEQGAIESAQSKLSAAVESARARLAEMASHAGDGAKEALSSVKEGIESMASSASSIVEPESREEERFRVKDEL